MEKMNKFTKLSIKTDTADDLELLRRLLGLRSLSEVVATIVEEKKKEVLDRG